MLVAMKRGKISFKEKQEIIYWISQGLSDYQISIKQGRSQDAVHNIRREHKQNLKEVGPDLDPNKYKKISSDAVVKLLTNLNESKLPEIDTYKQIKDIDIQKYIVAEQDIPLNVEHVLKQKPENPLHVNYKANGLRHVLTIASEMTAKEFDALFEHFIAKIKITDEEGHWS